MGLRSWWQGHGWDGTKETPVEQHTRTMEEQVVAFKARYAEPVPEIQQARDWSTTQMQWMQNALRDHGERIRAHRERHHDHDQGWER